MSINPLITHAAPNESLYLPANANIEVGTNLQASTITLAPQGYILLGDTLSDQNEGAKLIFDRSFSNDTIDILRKIRNKEYNDTVTAFPSFCQENDFYAKMAAGDIYVYGEGNESEAAYPVAVLKEDQQLGSLQILSDKVRIDNLAVSSINGAPYGGALGSNLNVLNVNTSTLTVNADANVQNLYNQYAEVGDLWVNNINGAPYTGGGGELSSFFSLTVSTLFASSIRANVQSGTIANFQVVNASTINAPNLVLPSTVQGNRALFSTLATVSISSIFGGFQVSLISSLQFNPSLGGFSPNVNLGMGGFLGGLLGGLGSGVFNTALGAAALGTGIAALTSSRPGNNINSNRYEMINTTTQLQISTLASDTTSYFRFANTSNRISTNLFLSSSVTLSSFSTFLVPGPEVIFSTIIPAGNTCIRSIGDPINLANSNIATSTVQAFGEWTIIPVTTQNVSSVVTFNTVVISTLVMDSIPGVGGGNSVISGGIPAADPISGYGINYNQLAPGSNEQEITTASSDASGGVSFYTTDNTSGLGKVYNKIFNVRRDIASGLGVITRAILSTTQIWGTVAFNAIPNALGTPVNPNDLTTKAYVDSMIAGGGGGSSGLYISSFNVLTDGGSPPITSSILWTIPPGTKYLMAEVLSGGGGTGRSPTSPSQPPAPANGENSFVTFPDGFQVSANGGGAGSAPFTITNLTGSANGNGSGKGNNAFAITSAQNPTPQLMTSGDGAYNKWARDVTAFGGCNLVIFVGNGGRGGSAGARGSAGTVWISYR